jgi:MOSC domain-containing protein YiiM
MPSTIISVARNDKRTFGKAAHDSITLVAGLGIEGDAHSGETMNPASRFDKGPRPANLRQVHLIAAELFDSLRGEGFEIAPGDIGENVTTKGIDLLGLPEGARLKLGETAIVEITGLRTPCFKLDKFQNGLKAALIQRNEEGVLTGRAGIMAIVVQGGDVKPGDAITVELPPEPHKALKPV